MAQPSTTECNLLDLLPEGKAQRVTFYHVTLIFFWLFCALRVTNGRERQVELGPFANCALHSYAAAHFLHYRFANAQPQTAARRIRLLMLGESTEVYKQATEFVGWNATAEVLHLQKELHITTGWSRNFRT